jgi:hypothetical protein
MQYSEDICQFEIFSSGRNFVEGTLRVLSADFMLCCETRHVLAVFRV